MEHDQEIDARDLLCPLPVLKARKKLAAMQAGQVLQLIATDPAALIDVPHFCGQTGHELLSVRDIDGARAYLIRCGNEPG